MSGATLQDWVFWLSGAVVALGGAVLGAWALFWDRSRGRNRCPKCWYDMSAAVPSVKDGREVFVCPECGRGRIEPSDLCRTRRRPVLALLGLGLVLAGYCGMVVQRVRQEGWTGPLPTTVLAVLGPVGDASWEEVSGGGRIFVEPPGGSLLKAAFERLGRGQMWGWQSQILIGRYFRAHPKVLKQVVELSKHWPCDVRVQAEVAYFPILDYDRLEIGLREKGTEEPWTYRSLRDAGYTQPCISLPGQPQGASGIVVEIDVLQDERRIWRGETAIPISIGGHADSFMTGVESTDLDEFVEDLKPSLVREDGGRVVLGISHSAFRNSATLGIGIELYHHGDCVGRSSVVFFGSRNRISAMYSNKLLVPIDWAQDKPPEFGNALQGWEMRVFGDVSTAMLDYCENPGDPSSNRSADSANRYWKGEFHQAVGRVFSLEEYFEESPSE